MAIIMYGKPVADKLKLSLKSQCEDKKFRLEVIMVGNDPASEVYVRNKERACRELGIRTETHHFSEDVTTEYIISVISVLNRMDNVNGILVQLPLPKHLDEKMILDSISATKDVDCFTNENIGKVFKGNPKVLPCTPAGILAMLDYYKIPIAGKHCVVLGRSNIVGKPMALLMLQRDATVTICHSKTKNLAEITRQADILIVAIGKAKFVTEDMVKDGAVVVDVGINRTENGLCGDVDFETVEPKCAAITPVPKGVGVMTVAELMANVVSNC